MPVLAFRFPLMGLRSRRRSPLPLAGESVVDQRVWPNDIDIFLHVNNGRYVTLLDLGRMDHLVRTGLLDVMRERRWQPVAGSVSIRFRRELRLGQRYRIRSRIVGRDERWFVYAQRIERRDGQLVADAWVKVALLSGGKLVPADEVWSAFRGDVGDMPGLSDAMRDWMRLPVG